jgi:ribosomal protein L32
VAQRHRRMSRRQHAKHWQSLLWKCEESGIVSTSHATLPQCHFYRSRRSSCPPGWLQWCPRDEQCLLVCRAQTPGPTCFWTSDPRSSCAAWEEHMRVPTCHGKWKELLPVNVFAVVNFLRHQLGIDGHWQRKLDEDTVDSRIFVKFSNAI